MIDAKLLDTKDFDAVYAAGREYAYLHQALARYPDPERIPPPADYPPPLTERIATLIESYESKTTQAKLGRLQGLADDADSCDLPYQLVHGDYRSANVLYGSKNVAAVLDFEEVHTDHLICDAARSAALLSTRYHNWSPTSTAVQDVFRDGIESVVPFTDTETAWWETLIAATTLLVFPEGND